MWQLWTFSGFSICSAMPVSFSSKVKMMAANAYQRGDILQLQILEVSSGILVELLSYLSFFFSDYSGTGSGAASWSFASRSKNLSFEFVVC